MTDDIRSSKAKPARRRFTQLIDALERAHARYAICGAVAMGAHGAERYTQDIDVLVADEDLESIIDELSASMRVLGREPAEGATKQVRLRAKRASGPGAVDIDLMAPIDAVEAWALATAVRARAFERKVDVASAEALVIMKLNAYVSDELSPRGMQHRADALRMLVEVGVDVSELRGFLRGHSRLEAELERALAAPPPRGRIR